MSEMVLEPYWDIKINMEWQIKIKINDKGKDKDVDEIKGEVKDKDKDEGNPETQILISIDKCFLKEFFISKV